MMKILAIETTGRYGSAAVIDGEGHVFSAVSTEEMNHLKGMIGLIDEAISKACTDKSGLTHIAASIGPGSFTGIRIGVTTARVMAQMLGVPCVAVSSLEGMVCGAMEAAGSAGARYIVPIINARRHQTYAAVYEAASGPDAADKPLVPVMEEKQYMIEELLAELPERAAGGAMIYFTGDGIDAYQDIIAEDLPEGSYTLAPEETRYQLAEPVARVALRKAADGQTVSYGGLMPEYMRLAEAEQKLKAGTLSERIRKPVQ